MSSTTDVDIVNYSAMVIDNLHNYLSVEERPYEEIDKLFRINREREELKKDYARFKKYKHLTL